MATKDYFRITDDNWVALKDALGTRKWSELPNSQRAVVKALVKAGYAEESSVDTDTVSADITKDLDKLGDAGFKAVQITMPEIVERSLSEDLVERLVTEKIAVRILKGAHTWRISSERV